MHRRRVFHQTFSTQDFRHTLYMHSEHRASCGTYSTNNPHIPSVRSTQTFFYEDLRQTQDRGLLVVTRASAAASFLVHRRRGL